MITLGIDTSYEVAVGVARDGVPEGQFVVPDTRAHAESLMPSVLALLAHHGLTLNDVDEVAVGMGPGPFTGLRVGIVAAWTLAELRGVVPRGVCSLDVLARQWVRAGAPDEFVIASDARRKEWYWARYEGGVRVEGPCVSAPESVPAVPLAGPVAPTADRIDASILAADWTLLPAVDEPLYLRGADATVSTRTKSALPRPTVRRKR